MKKFKLIAGPCVIENLMTPMRVASELQRICDKLDIEYIFKSSYVKANRTHKGSFETIGISDALGVLGTLKEMGHTILTDVHESIDVRTISPYVDILQVPSFLCRQTQLIETIAVTGKPINIKKGQFASPQSMKYAVEKFKRISNSDVYLTERGTSCGTQQLIVDVTGIPIMKEFADHVVIDATHSVQQPNQGKVTKGNPEMIETIALAGIVAGADTLFVEVHPNPKEALSDAQSQLHLEKAEALISKAVNLYKFLNETKT
jgi:2-dehydro-3-deoxyphosphooctonate aldolase (KDO 8-P synthase)